MKALIYFAVFVIVTISQVYADVCSDKAARLISESEALLTRSALGYDNLKNFFNDYNNFKAQTSNLDCYATGIEQTKELVESLKNKRIQTIKRYLGFNIKEEAGQNIQLEYDYLTGAGNKYKYEFESLFSNPNTPPPKKENTKVVVTDDKKNQRQYEAPLVITPINQVPVTPGVCGDKIVESPTVNLQNVRDQDSIGWCYAYLAADLLSFKLGKKISAVSLFSSSTNEEIKNDLGDENSGGNIKKSIEGFLKRKNGLCLEEDLPSSDFKFCLDKNYQGFLKRLLSVVEKGQFDIEMSRGQCFSQQMRAAFPGISQNNISRYIAQSGTEKLVEYIYDQMCSQVSFQGIKIEPKIEPLARHGGPDGLLNIINRQIANNDIVGIAYDYSKINPNRPNTLHGSIIVGRGTNPKTGKCEYLVRNSWGKTCEMPESADITCHKNCTGNSCRQSGHFWISETLLKKSLLEVSTLQ